MNRTEIRMTHSSKKSIKARKRSRSIQLRRRILIISFLLTAFISIVIKSMVSVEAQVDNKNQMKKEYYSVEISKGESLWSIAKENIGAGYSDIDDYIDDIKKINKLENDDIHEGCYLIIPRYVSSNN